jgi:aspartate aminotransferase
MSLFNQRIRAMMAEGRTVYHFGFGQSPFPVVDGARRALAEYAGEIDYLPLQGLPALRAQICEFHAKMEGVTDLDPECVFIGPGSKQLIFMLISVYKGDILLVSPTWLSYKPMIDHVGKRIIEIDSTSQEDWKLTPERLEEALCENEVSANPLLILCNPNNPTGVTYTADDFRALRPILRKHNVTVLSDEVYGHLSFDGNFQGMAKYYPEGTITSSGISKIFGAGDGGVATTSTRRGGPTC